MAFSQKRQRLYDLSPDVAVVPECAKKSIDVCIEDGFDGRWFGDNLNKGLGILVAKPWSIVRVEEPPTRWVVPLWIAGPFDFLLVAVWTTRMNGSFVRSYVGQAYEAVTKSSQWFRGQPTAICGDFNSNSIWDRKRKHGNHSALVKYLGEQKLASAYHRFFSEDQGEETRPTHYYWHQKERGFHIDYIFIPEDWAKRISKVEVGEYECWSSLSDHVPIVVDVL
jgi:hypothetical protein